MLLRISILVVTIVLLADVDAKKSDSISKPKKCQKDDSWFMEKKAYHYTYTGVVQSGITGTSPKRSGYMFTCVLSVTCPRKCEMVLKIKKCFLKQRSPNPADEANAFEEISESKQFSREMSKYKVYFQMQDGLVKEDTVVVDDRESLDVINIKRGMLSALQLQRLTKADYDTPQTLNDVYGSCPTKFERTEEKVIIHSSRDIATCSYPEIYLKQIRLLSRIKELTGGFMKKNYTEAIYPFESAIDCDYELEGSNLATVKCFHHQAMIPFTFNGTIKAGAMTNISQVMELDEVLPHNSRKIDRSLKAKHVISLEYDFGDQSEPVSTPEEVFEGLKTIATTLLEGSITDVPAQFLGLVNMLRSLSEEQVQAAYDKVKNCPQKRCPKQQKAAMDKFIGDGFLSCGTSACITIMAKHYADTQLDSIAVTAFLLDLTLRYNSAVDNTVNNVLEICKTKKTGTCLLLLSGFARTFASKLDQEELQSEDGAVYKTVKYIRDKLGENCKPGVYKNSLGEGNKGEQLSMLLTALKSFGNIGHYVQDSFDQNVESNRQVVPTLISCANNEELPELARKSAILALQKMNLDDPTRRALFTITEDKTSSVVLRTSAFSILARDEQRATLKNILELVKEESNTHIRTYMLTHIINLLESQDPRFRTLQTMWKQLLKDLGEKLPELGVYLYRKSRYAELSRTMIIPLLQRELGATLELNILYEPVSFLPRSVNVNITVNRMGNVYHVLEFGFDIAGFETIAEMFIMKRGQSNIGLMDMLKFMVSGADLEKIKATMAQIMAAKKAAAAAAAQGGAGGASQLPAGLTPQQIQALRAQGRIPPGAIPPGGAPPKGMAGKTPAVPPTMAALMELLKKPDISYIPDDVKPRFQKIIDDANIPQLTMPSGHVYVKLLGSEIAFTTLETVAAKLRSLIAERGISSLINVQKLMERLVEGDNFIAGTFSQFYDLHKRIPTLLGVPINLEVHGTRGIYFDGNAKANLKGILVKGEPVNGNLTIRARGSRLFTGEMSVRVPTLSEKTGLKMNLLGSLNLGVRGGLAFDKQEFKLYRHNIDGPKDLYTIDGNLHLIHMKDEESIEGDEEYRNEVEKCSSPRLQALTGRKICWIATYQNGSESTSLPYFPLTGRQSGRLSLIPVDSELKLYSLIINWEYLKESVAGSDDPNAFYVIRHTVIKYEAPGEKLNRMIKAEFRRNLNTTDLEGTLTVPEPYESKVTFLKQGFVNRRMKPGMKPGMKATDQPFAAAQPKIISLKWTRGDTLFYGFSANIKSQRDVEKIPDPASGLTVFSPTVHVDMELEFAIPNITLSMNVTSDTAVGAQSSNTKADIKYFCSRKNSLFYMIHPNPKEAMANGDTSYIYITNDGKFEKVGDRDWKVNDVFNMKYTGQDMTLTNVMWTEKDRKDIYRDTDATWLNREGGKEQLIMNSHSENKSTAFNYDYIFNSKVNRVNKWDMTLDGTLKGVLAELNGNMDINYKKKDGSRRKRSDGSFAQTFNKYEEKLKSAASYLKSVFEATAESDDSPMAGDDPVVSFMDRDEWKMTNSFRLNRNPLVGAPGSTKWQFNMTYPRAGTYHDVKIRGKHFRGLDPIMGGFRFVLGAGFDSTYLDRTVEQDFNYFRSPTKVVYSDGLKITKISTGETTRELNITARYQPGRELFYYRALASLPINSSLTFHYTKDPEEQTSTLDINSQAASTYRVFNHLYRRNSVIKGTKLTSSSNFIFALGNLTGGSELKWNLPNRGISYRADYNLQPRLEGGMGFDADVKFDYDNNTLATFKITATRTDIEKKSIVNGELKSPTELNFKILTQKDGAKKPVESLSWDMTMTSHDRIQNNVTWRPEVGHLVFQTLQAQLNNSFVMATDVLALSLTNFKRNFTDRIIPVVNKTWGDMKDKYLKPHWDKVVSQLNEIPIPNSDRTVGEIAQMVLNRIKAYPFELRQRLYNLLPGHLLEHSGLKKRVIYLLSERAPLYLKAWQKRRPPMTRTLYARKIKPLIEKRLREAKTSFSISHPLIWDSFLTLPRPTHTTRALVHWVYRNLPRFVRRDFLWKKFSFNSRMFDPEYINTFDGQLLMRPTEIQKDSCTHLMAADFVRGSFALLATGDTVTYFSPSLTVSLDKNCRVRIDNADTPVELPWSSKDEQANATIHDSLVWLDFSSRGIKLHCNPTTATKGVDMAGYRYNHSLGLLGANDREPATDFRLPNGQVTENINEFLNAYELSGKARCQSNEPMPTAEDEGCRPVSEKCGQMFGPSSPLRSCFPMISPGEFRTMCEATTKSCNVEKEPDQIVGDLVGIYVEDCRSRGINVDNVYATCGKKKLGSTWTEKINGKMADVVFVISRNMEMESKTGGLVEYAMNIAKKLKYQDVKFGLVTYGSAILRNQALTHTLDGQVFGGEGDLKKALQALTLDSTQHFPAHDALHTAVGLNFRPNSHRIVFLLTEWNHVVTASSPVTPLILSSLNRNSVTINVVSMYEPISASKLMALRYDGKATLFNGKNQQIDLPMDDFGQLVRESKGFMLYLEKYKSAGNKLLRNLHKYIQDEMAEGQGGMCRQCGCYSGRGGEGVSLCKAVDC